MHTDLDSRRARYARLSTELSHLDDRALASLLGEHRRSSGWGVNQIVRIGGSSVFVKRIPVTDRELARRYDTRNHFRLPFFYNYGVGSGGLGVFRELAGHVTTTNWVLAGEVETFPLAYHHRIVPLVGDPVRFAADAHRAYVRYWNGSRAVDRFITERADARHEAVVFLEHIPHTLARWILRHLDRLPGVVRELWDTVTLLRSNGVVHFDVHLWNVLTDGERPYLTDFGLLLDRRFQLTDRERTFLREHIDYDYGELLWSVGSVLSMLYAKLSQTRRRALCVRHGIDDPQRILRALVERAGEIHRAGSLPLDASYVDLVLRYRDVIGFFDDFIVALQTSNRKDARFDARRLRRLLRAAGAPDG